MFNEDSKEFKIAELNRVIDMDLFDKITDMDNIYQISTDLVVPDDTSVLVKANEIADKVSDLTGTTVKVNQLWTSFNDHDELTAVYFNENEGNYLAYWKIVKVPVDQLVDEVANKLN